MVFAMNSRRHCGNIGELGQRDTTQVKPEKAADASPVWDDVTGRFWCATSVNAYDIPDGRQWQDAFQKALAQHEPVRDPLQTLDVNKERLRNVVLPPCEPWPLPTVAENEENNMDVALASPPMTPKKISIRRKRESPKTPPLFRATDPEKRAQRAVHTKALQSMRQKAGVTAIVLGREIAFFRFDGQIYAVSARCPHQGGNLCEGEVGDIEDLGRQHYVTCPVHKMQFDLQDGRVLDGNCGPLQTYSVRVTAVDQDQKFAPVEVGFESLTDAYFAGDLLF
jgi:nitrite reductase/ring-hydroxylating ferredoxin subunit